MRQFKKLSHILVIGGGLMLLAGCDEKTVQQAMRGLGMATPAPINGLAAPSNPSQQTGSAGGITIALGTGNANSNANDNTDDNSNDNAGNSNDNSDDNANDNSDDNSNDNTGDGLCPDGSTRLGGEIDSPVELEAEYRLFPAGCARFRVKVRDYVAGTYDVQINGTAVGSIVVGDNGRGELEFDTEDGSFPASFPMMAMGDVVQVGAYSVTMGDDCSSDDVDTCTGNGNSNDNSNSNGNANDNSDDNSNDNGDDNLNDNSDDHSNDNVGDSNDNADDNSNDNDDNSNDNG